MTLSKATEPTTKRGEGSEQSDAIKSGIEDKGYGDEEWTQGEGDQSARRESPQDGILTSIIGKVLARTT